MVVRIGDNLLPPPYDWGIISGDYSYNYAPLDWVLEATYKVYSKGWVRPSGM